LERVARERILKKVRALLKDLNHFIPETISTWSEDIKVPLTFGNFIEETGLSPIDVLKKGSWSSWKARGFKQPLPSDSDLVQGQKALLRIALRTDPIVLKRIEKLQEDRASCNEKADIGLHYLLWAKTAKNAGISSTKESIERWRSNPTLAADASEIAQWRRSIASVPTRELSLNFPCNLRLHAAYGSAEVKAALGLATLLKSGPTGQGVLLNKKLKCYIHLITFRKDEKSFSPSTRYKDYPISLKKLHWQTPSNQAIDHSRTLDYLNFQERNYTVLFFARVEEREDGETAPSIFLGPAKEILSAEGDRPVSITWELEHDMPAELFEKAKAV
jgi:hypothetical protein